ncbi:phosphoesterase [Bacillus canaveralius]|uniref:Phosphoesterase n=1 Tax=Bacillus canaveralius TaxID=1403243 RepID=A0A2N5GPD9_9BACI|nr:MULTISPECIES: metallophosphoesterase [Bacillus]PLR84412.1 phosphoesterase [Bacillus canaveralius]PLR87003.1 phosphoesterase [Bacillus sp. V33-4]PLS00586.1 phosphoesterase [Bacillus canaveralius]RSK57870.1 metallophosphoesterase [Bacillus canaveralius]
MSISTILMIITTILAYSLICFYVGYNGWVWLRATFSFPYKKAYIAVIVLFSASIFLGQFSSMLPLILMGHTWLVVIGYSVILLPLANLLVYILKKRGIFWIGIGVISIFMFIFVYGSFNAWNPVVRSYHLEIDKQSGEQNVKILMVSDLHLGSIVGERHLQRLVDVVDEEKPDIILIPGDIIDDHIDPFLEKNMSETMKKISAPLGVYAVLGNHDYYGDDTALILDEMEKLGIRVLMDESVSIDEQFYLIGRKDLTDENRNEASALLRNLDKTKPLIMMDHQPVELNEAKENGIDVLLSGHTHRGQLAPANLITSKMYENDWGYLQKENLHSFVSSGFGIWGPPLRIGSRSEVMVIDVKFASN